MKISEKLTLLEEQASKIENSEGAVILIWQGTDCCEDDMNKDWHVGFFDQGKLFSHGLGFSDLEDAYAEGWSLPKAIDELTKAVNDILAEQDTKELDASFLGKTIKIGDMKFKLSPVED